MNKLIIKKDMIGKVIIAEKDYVVYKRVNQNGFVSNNRGIAVLLIPKGSKIVIPIDYNSKKRFKKKLRCNLAICLYIIPFIRNWNGKERKYDLSFQGLPSEKQVFKSIHKPRFKYKQGKVLKPYHPLSENTSGPCHSGIHFFTDVKEAERY